MKAIQTEYNGYKFRSRLEARWAVFFDVMSVPYEYELEGYDLGDGEWYLPDFYLPRHQAHVEIKGGEGNKFEHAKKLRKLCEAKGEYGLLLVEDPYSLVANNSKKSILICDDMTDGSGGVCDTSFSMAVDEMDRLVLWPDCATRGSRPRTFFGASFGCIGERVVHVRDDRDLSINMIDSGLPTKAAKAARQARFEHGETPCFR